MRLLAGLAAVVLAAAATVPSDYVQQIENWRHQREQRLKADDGWLTVAGLFWLHEGENRIKLPAGSPQTVATFSLHNGKVTYRNGGGQMELKPDTSGDPTEVKINDITMFLIQRADRYGIRLKDKNSSYRRNFTGLKWYPVRPEYLVEARFIAAPKRIPIL